jgi:transcriptional regulator with XRE-family HTH domain
MTGQHQAQLAAFGRRLRTLRKQRNLSQHELAQQTGMRESEISRYERGRRDPQLTTILRLARGLEVAPGELLDPAPATRTQPINT